MLLCSSNFAEDRLFEKLYASRSSKKGFVNKGVIESMIFDWIEWHKRIHVNNPISLLITHSSLHSFETKVLFLLYTLG